MTLRENNLKEIEGGRIMDSEGVLIGNAAALRDSPELLAVVHELIERLEVRPAAQHAYAVGSAHTAALSRRCCWLKEPSDV